MVARGHSERRWGRSRARGRAWARRLALLVGFTLLCAAVAAGAWLARATPVEFQGGSVWSERGSGPHTVVHPEFAQGVGVAYASLGERGRFTSGLDVSNTGRFDVRITGLGHVERPAGLAVELWMDAARPRGESGGIRLVPFEPFTLRPGDFRYVAVGVRLPGDSSCAPGSASFRGAVQTMPLRFELFGVIRRTAEIPLQRVLGVVCGERPAPWPPEPHSGT